MADENVSEDGKGSDLQAAQSYKSMLRDLIDRRPSGTRQRLAEAFRTHKSFVSQVLSPSSRVPLPAQHIPALFEVCHLSADERATFLQLYRRAHPSQTMLLDGLAEAQHDILRIRIPEFADPALRAEAKTMITALADTVLRLLMARDRTR